MFLLQFRGEIAALSVALIWAVASLIYTGIGRQLSPLALNFTKGWIAIAFFILTIVLLKHPIPVLDSIGVLLLFLSGAIGIGFGDTAYFNALNCIGPRRTLLFETLAPPLSAILAFLFLRERLLIQAWFGIALTIGGVLWVVMERTPDLEISDSDKADRPTGNIRPGIGSLYALLATLGQSGGAVLSRAALISSEIDTLWSTLIRLIGGTVVLWIWILVQQQKREAVKPFQSGRLLSIIAGAALISTYFGVWLQQISLKFAPTGIAQALSSTSPLFIIAIVLAVGERVSVRSVLGVVIAVIGVSLLFTR